MNILLIQKQGPVLAQGSSSEATVSIQRRCNGKSKDSSRVDIGLCRAANTILDFGGLTWVG
jgi:hypothetical protein